MVADRLLPYTINVSRSDSCLSRYTEQIWCSGRAPIAAICALTGRTINRGDQVLRPRTRGMPVPAGCYRMILAEMIVDCSDLAITGASDTASYLLCDHRGVRQDGHACRRQDRQQWADAASSAGHGESRWHV
ncbi:DUF3331 domain-containing protein [Paraburkholderia sp. JHI869]|uniref:DUF3331 domain-containing protein n=1 Tax=Paraburkholderia sp. JHI869 TaxID=3112959 RepID=UPI00316D4BC5